MYPNIIKKLVHPCVFRVLSMTFFYHAGSPNWRDLKIGIPDIVSFYYFYFFRKQLLIGQPVELLASYWSIW